MVLQSKIILMYDGCWIRISTKQVPQNRQLWDRLLAKEPETHNLTKSDILYENPRKVRNDACIGFT